MEEQEPIKLRIEKGDKAFILECPHGTTLGELYDACDQFRNYAIGRMKEPSQPSVEEKQDVE